MQYAPHRKTSRGARGFAAALTAAVTLTGFQIAVAPAANAVANGAVGDYVWHDVDVDGIQDSWEPGIGGMEVSLIGPDGGEMLRTTTNENGFYQFTDLEDGEYAVQFAILSEDASYTSQYAGNDETLDSNADSPSGRTEFFTINGANPTVDHVDAGVVMEGGPRPVTGSIGDRVWLDRNVNGIQDPGEWDQPGVDLALENEAGQVIARTTSDGNGEYRFSGLDSGTYYVRASGFAQGMVLSPPGRGSDPERDSNASPATGRTGAIRLGAGASTNSVDFGVYYQR